MSSAPSSSSFRDFFFYFLHQWRVFVLSRYIVKSKLLNNFFPGVIGCVLKATMVKDVNTNASAEMEQGKTIFFIVQTVCSE